jgi:hypothetical protein
MRKMLLLVLAGALLWSGCKAPPPPPPPFKPVADMKQLMTSVVDPAADVIWGSVGTIVNAAGTIEKAPKTDEEWAAVRNSAYVLTESGNLLMIGNRPKDTGEWIRFSQELIDVGVRTIKAAEARNKDAIFEVGGEIYNVCSNCHEKYEVKISEAETPP